MSSYKELLKQRDEIEKKIQDARQRELAEAVGKVRVLIAEYGLSAADVFPPARASRGKSSRSKVPAKYKNPTTGETWTGRGKAPKWIQNQDRSKFEI